jgi:hypothetical protein
VERQHKGAWNSENTVEHSTIEVQAFLRRNKLPFLKNGDFTSVILGFCHSFPINKITLIINNSYKVSTIDNQSIRSP